MSNVSVLPVSCDFFFLTDKMTSAPKVKSHGADLAGFLQYLCLGFVSKLLAQAFLEYLSYSVNLAYSINERQKPCHLAQAFFVLFSGYSSYTRFN